MRENSSFLYHINECAMTCNCSIHTKKKRFISLPGKNFTQNNQSLWFSHKCSVKFYLVKWLFLHRISDRSTQSNYSRYVSQPKLNTVKCDVYWQRITYIQLVYIKFTLTWIIRLVFFSNLLQEKVSNLMYDN